ncbi:MAG: hypothetical protein ABIA76_01925 [Candidatus Diapherotrites archaeon]
MKYIVVLFAFLLLFASGALAENTPFFCSSNSQCNDSDPVTLDICVRPGQYSSGCANLSCTPLCSSNSDCVPDGNNLVGVCTGIGRCTAQCVYLPSNTYNDGLCQEYESSCSVPNDCDSCYESAAGCLEKNCIGNSCRKTIALGCCGNGICEFKEDFSTCSEDCKPRVLSVDILDDFSAKNFFRGDEVFFRVKVVADGILANSADVRIKGFFGELKLLNDSDHNDGSANDGVFANIFKLDKTIEKGIYSLEITASFAGVQTIVNKNLFVDPKIEINGVVVPSSVTLGEEMRLSFRTRKGEKNIASKTIISGKFASSNDVFFKEELLSGEDGLVSVTYRTSFVDSFGEWTISVEAEDEFGNHGLENFKVMVLNPDATAFLDISLANDLNKNFFRGEKIPLNVLVKDELGVKLTNVETYAMAFGKKIQLIDLNGGKYSAEITVPFDAAAGENSLRIESSLMQGEKFFSGSFSFDFNVESVDLTAILISPDKSVDVGEKINFILKVTYPNGKPVAGPVSLPAQINDLNIELLFVGDGIFQAEYLVDEKDFSGIHFEVNSDDSYGNKVVFSSETSVLGFSFIYFLRKNALIIFISSVLVLAVFFVAFRHYFTSQQKARLVKRKNELIEEVKKVQKQYFADGALDKLNYEKIMFKLEAELKEINHLIEEGVKK